MEAAEVRRLRALVEQAYRDGLTDGGLNTEVTALPDWWACSAARKALDVV